MPVIGFGVPIHESVEGYTFTALTHLWAAWPDLAPADWTLKIAVSRGCSVTENRNRITAELLTAQHGGQFAPRSRLTTQPADVIVWSDSDCCVEPDEYVRLVQSLLRSTAAGAVGYAFPMQTDGRPRPNVGRDSGPPITWEAPGPVRLVGVDWLGFGVVATRAAVYERMVDAGLCEHGNWFTHTSGAKGRGEDIGWCRMAREAGYALLCDVGVLGAHCYRAPHRLSDFYAQFHKEG